MSPQTSIHPQAADGNLWQVYADTLYTNPSYADLIFTDAHTKKKVFFTTSDPTPALVAQLEKRGLAVVVMWAERDNFAKGEWAFFSPCRDPVTNSFTSSIPPEGPGLVGWCNQSVTTNSPIGAMGTSMTVSPSYQLSYSSLPFQVHMGLPPRIETIKS